MRRSGSRTLGKFPLPVEVVRFGLVATRNMVAAHAAEAGCEGEIKLRLGKDGTPFVTDSGNLLLDCAFGRIDKPEMLDDALKRVPGVVENGLFLGIADVAIVAGPDGVVVLERDVSREEQLTPAVREPKDPIDVLPRASPRLDPARSCRIACSPLSRRRRMRRGSRRPKS